MEKKYVIGLLLLIGMGIVSTMAFTINTSIDSTATIYDIDSAAATGSVTAVRVLPWGSRNVLRIKLTTNPGSAAYNISLSFEDNSGAMDLSGFTVTANAGAGTLDTSYLADGIIVVYNIPNTVTNVLVKVDGTGGSFTNSFYEDLTHLIVAIADY